MAYLNVFLKSASSGASNRLPCPTGEPQPIIAWEIPEDVMQTAFCLELKSRLPTRLSDGTYGYAYYSSATIQSAVPEHQIAYPMYQNVWAGAVEVRIRIYSGDAAVYSTHDASGDTYAFEPVPQGLKWDSTYDGYYFLVDPDTEQITGTMSPTFTWRNVTDEDDDAARSYQLQWSLTPLFLDGVLGRLGLSSTRTADAPAGAGVFSSLSTVVDVKAPVFYRVRAFDGLDYGPWSPVAGYFSSPSSAPYCMFNWVVTNCTSDDPNVLLRPDGEIEISFRVADLDSPIVSAYLTYRLNTDEALVRKPCSLDSSTVSIPSNRDVTVCWHSARQLPNRSVIVYLYLYAYDGYAQSYEVAWSSSVAINNAGVGFGYSDSTDDVMSYRFSCGLRNYERLLMIPEEKAQATVQDGETVYTPAPMPEGDYDAFWQFGWAEYWADRLGRDVPLYRYAPADQIAHRFGGGVKRPDYNIYDGYDGDGRLEADRLRLEYRDEFYARERDAGEEFHEYFRIGQNVPLGRGIRDVTWFVKEPGFGGRIRIRRPVIVRAGNSGLYYDGMALNCSADDVFGDVRDDPDIEALKRKEVWRNFYQLDPVYRPEVKFGFSFLGPADPGRYDSENRWYWTLFEYAVTFTLPVGITRDVNDRFAYRLNGVAYSGSVLEDGVDRMYVPASEKLSDQLRALLNRLFPTDVFQDIEDRDLTAVGGQLRIVMRSRMIDSNRTFRFADVEHSCYRLFGVDTGPRFSRREKCSGTGDSDRYVTSRPYEEKKQGLSDAVYEVPCDTGDCIGRDGEMNTSEPLFTCDPVHLNQYGCHYKYTERRYLETHRVYIRKYYVRPVYMAPSSEPLRGRLPGETSAPVMGWRDYRLKYVGENGLGEPLYVKDMIPGRIGGAPARRKRIPVIFEKKPAEDCGWWAADGDVDAPGQCVSHEYSEEEKAYYRRAPGEFVKQIGFQDCLCAEYVELEEGWEKPFFNESQNVGRIDRRQTVAHAGDVPQGYIQYVMGAYRPPPSQKDVITEYESGFTSSVEYEPGYSLRRYGDNWDESGYERLSEKLGTVVDPVFIEPGGTERSMEKWGYVPDHTLETYFKEDSEGIWKDRMIPRGNSYVHGVLRDSDVSFPYVSAVHMFRRLLSDTSRVALPESEGVKAPYIDYRLRGGSPLEARYYYSALPQDESPEYATRPPEIYGEDRPLRISGFIDSMSAMIPWRFLYLQTEWNTYNLIHWEGGQDESVYARLEVAQVDSGGTTGNFMTLRTRQAEWFPQYSCWLIPFVKLKQSDYIDTLNGTFTAVADGTETDCRFEEGGRYRFRISGVNIHSGAANTPALSGVFTYSKDAYSPPIITAVNYDRWKHEFCIEFRFDDARGRKYDVINFYYAAYDPGEQSPPDSAFIELGTDCLDGSLVDLDSNRTGDDVVSDAYLIRHRVYFSSDVLQDVVGKNIRFRLESIASEDREGMTAPVFSFLMWGNEFLKKADDQIGMIAGRRNRWAYRTFVDDEGETVEQWVYLPEDQAVTVPGTLAEQAARIEEINQKFDDWYVTVAKFREPGFDARYHFMIIGKTDAALYDACFDAFVAQYGLEAEWTAYREARTEKTESYLKPLFIDAAHSDDFAFFWDNRASFLADASQGFDAWFEENRILSREEAKPVFIERTGRGADYRNFLKDGSLTDGDESRTDYIVTNSLQSVFEDFYESLNNYPDSRYDDRKAFVEAHYSAEFGKWREAPTDAYGGAIAPDAIALEDEALRLFIAHSRAIWDAIVYENAGRQRAKNYFLSVAENGVTYGQRLQTANSAIVEAQKTLNAAYAVRNRYETLHRRRLIAKGYFSNGWKNNQVYVYDESGRPELNEPFRFRVENQPVTGKRSGDYEGMNFGDSYPLQVQPLPGYDTRWDIYFHFQLDFYDSFDSQDGKPLRDYLWQRQDCSGYLGGDPESMSVDGVSYIRIMGGIEAESGGMHILPDNVYTPNANEYGKAPTTDDPYSFQFAGRFSIPKSELPGELETDRLPEYWNTGKDSGSDDFNQVYFWRVCPYNLVKRPIFEKSLGSVSSVEFFGSTRNHRYWKACVENDFRGNHRYSRLQHEDASSYGEDCFLWVGTGSDSPQWKTDFQSECWNGSEAYYENFFPGTDRNRSDIDDHTANPARASYRARIERGEVVFLTDRPRELLDGELRYIEDATDHFKSLWIQFNVKRHMPWMMFDDDEKCYFLISQKHSKNRAGYTEYVFTLSRGLSQQTFGEECQLFPASTLDSAGSVIDGAQSFEDPCLLKTGKTYVLYFNVRKDGGVYESWRTESGDLYDWRNFTRLKFLYGDRDYGQSCRAMSVYLRDGVYCMYCVQDTSIRKFTGTDGVAFTYASTVHSEMYTLTRPTLVHDRIYFGIEFGPRGKILSISESGGYATLRTEKGAPSDFNEGIAFGDEDLFFNPMVFEDRDRGVPVARMVYEKPLSAYAYVDGRIRELPSVQEKAFLTEYREEYSWRKVRLFDGMDAEYWSASVYIDGENHPVIRDSGGDAVVPDDEYTLMIPTGKLEILFASDEEPEAVKVPFYLEPGFEDVESEGEWIDFHNVSRTEAVISPEEAPFGYEASDYTTERYILENNLLELYDAWLSERHPERGPDDGERNRTEFLLESRQYSLFLKWGRKGPGVYRHLNAVKRTSYTGDGE